MEDTSLRLYKLGRDDLESRYDPDLNLVRNRFLPDRHPPHDSLWYAHCLFRDGRSDEATSVVNTALDLQELRQEDPHRGNFWWHKEDGVVIDLNACQFVLEALLALPADNLPGGLKQRIASATELAYAEAARLDVHWTYTNIYLLDVHNRIVGGERLGDGSLQRAGLDRLRAWAEKTRQIGAPHEFNSPTYAAVHLNCLAGIAQRSGSDEARALAREMEALTWTHIAKYWHPPTMQLGGPHSRAYRRDVAGASGFLKTVLYRVLGDERLLGKTPYYKGHDAEGHVIVSRIDYSCPPEIVEQLTSASSRTVHEAVLIDPPVTAANHSTTSYTLGTMSRPYGVGYPPEPWPQNNSCIAYWQRSGAPGYGVLYSRYRVNAGKMGETSPYAPPSWLDMWEEGVFRTSQWDSTAIVAYGLMPRGIRPVTNLRLDIRLLGPDPSAVLLPGGALWTGELVALEAGPLVIADGSAYMGIIPLTASNLGRNGYAILWRDGVEIVLSIVNYDGPPKMFWEYRSLSGPFWKGNVLNGFIVSIADKTRFLSARAFADELASAPLTDVVHGSTRRVSIGRGNDVVSLEYDLRDMWP